MAFLTPNVYLAIMGVLFVVCYVLTAVGTVMTQKQAWFNREIVVDDVNTDDSLLTGVQTSFAGLMFTAIFLPLTFVFGGAFSLAVFKYPVPPTQEPVAKALKAGVFVGLFIGAVCGASYAWKSDFGKAYKVLTCGVLWCYKFLDDDEDDGAAQFHNFVVNYPTALGAATFFPALLACAFEALLFLNVLLVPNSASPPVEAGAVAYRRIGSKPDNQARPSDPEMTVPLVVNGDGRKRAAVGDRARVGPPGGVSALGKFLRFALTLGAVFFLLVACGWIPQNWENFTREGLRAYVTFADDDLTDDVTTDPAATAEWDDATMKTTRWTLTPNLRLYLFPDLLIFYGFLAFVTVIGSLSFMVPSLGRVLHHRFLVARSETVPKYLWAWIGAPPFSISVGGIIVLLAFAVTLILFVDYWAVDHAYHAEKGGAEEMSSTQITARTLGQVGNFIMGLMLFPVSKNSILTTAFGVAWEQVIFIHTLLGECFMAVIVVHMLCWYGVYNEQAIPMPDAIFSVPAWFPTNLQFGALNPETYVWETPPNPGNPKAHEWWAKYMFDSPKSDNWTIPMISLVFWASLICTGVFAQSWVRRMNYELFYYMHHIYLVLFIATLWHAASAWYYLIGGLSLWFVDRCIRAFQRSRRWSLSYMGVYAKDKVTHLEFTPQQDLLGRLPDFTYSCGQYLYLNIPAVAPHEWHPFTISAAPSDGIVSCHIKVAPKMGICPSMKTGGTPMLAPFDMESFTGKLHTLALTDPDPLSLTVNIDGPYGEWLDHSKFDRIMLIAGGIGVTPIHSIFRDLWNQVGAGTCRCTEVFMVWVNRETSGIDPFVSTLQAAQDDTRNGVFHFSLHVDVGLDAGETQEYKGVPVKGGRCPITDLIQEFSTSGTPGDVPHVFVCGPPGLAAAADTKCLENGVSFHKEVFAF